jgi:hypothetical protein
MIDCETSHSRLHPVRVDSDVEQRCQALWGGPTYGNSVSRSAWDPTLSSVTFPIREDSQKGILDVVGQCPAIVWKGRRARGVIAQQVRQQFPCNPPCFLRRIPTGVLQRVREDGDEAGIVRRLPAQVGGILLVGQEDRLCAFVRSRQIR